MMKTRVAIVMGLWQNDTGRSSHAPDSDSFDFGIGEKDRKPFILVTMEYGEA